MQGEPNAESEVPNILDQRPTAQQVQDALDHQLEEDVDETVCSEDGYDETALELQEQHAQLEQEMDLEEIMAESSEEELLQEAFAGKHKRVKTFQHREAYRKLQDRGLVDIPSVIPGVFLGCHGTSRAWQGWLPDFHSGLSYTWGGATGRTEPEALLRVIQSLLECHCKRFPKDKLWPLQLEKVQHAAATVHKF